MTSSFSGRSENRVHDMNDHGHINEHDYIDIEAGLGPGHSNHTERFELKDSKTLSEKYEDHQEEAQAMRKIALMIVGSGVCTILLLVGMCAASESQSSFCPLFRCDSSDETNGWLDPREDFRCSEYAEAQVRSWLANGNKIGAGGFGTVHHCKAPRDELNVLDLEPGSGEVDIVVKKLKDTSLAGGFGPELRQAKLRHPNIARIYGYATVPDGTTGYIVQEHVKGCDLFGYLRKREQRPASGIAHEIHLLLGAAKGLCALHKSGIIHRDVKSTNLMVRIEDDHTAKWIDFGLSRQLQPCETDAFFSYFLPRKCQETCGTPGYACPEYARTGVADEATDVYAFGMIILEVMTGRAPVQEDWVTKNLVYPLDYVTAKRDDPGAFRTRLREILAGGMAAQENCEVAKQLGGVARECVAADPKARPKCDEIVRRIGGLTVGTGNHRTIRNPDCIAAQENCKVAKQPGQVARECVAATRKERPERDEIVSRIKGLAVRTGSHPNIRNPDSKTGEFLSGFFEAVIQKVSHSVTELVTSAGSVLSSFSDETDSEDEDDDSQSMTGVELRRATSFNKANFDGGININAGGNASSTAVAHYSYAPSSPKVRYGAVVANVPTQPATSPRSIPTTRNGPVVLQRAAAAPAVRPWIPGVVANVPIQRVTWPGCAPTTSSGPVVLQGARPYPAHVVPIQAPPPRLVRHVAIQGPLQTRWVAYMSLQTLGRAHFWRSIHKYTWINRMLF